MTPVSIGPMDPDSTAELGQVSGKHDARTLIAAHRSLLPPELKGKISLPVDGPRSEVLNEHLDELDEALSGLDGLPDGEIVGAGVRGARRNRVVSLIIRVESGRTVKAAVGYDDIPEEIRGKADGAAKVAEAREKGLPFLPAGMRLVADDGSTTVSSEGGAEVDELKRQLAEAKAAADAAEQKAADAAKAADDAAANAEEASTPPEPFEGYSDATVDDVAAAIDAVESPLDRELLKRATREAEEAGRGKGGKVRDGVLKATEPTELVEAPPGDETGA